LSVDNRALRARLNSRFIRLNQPAVLRK
jgi:hypothetical protein